MPGPYGCAAVLMGSKPCLAGAYLGRQGDAVMHNVFHFFFQDALYLIALCLGRLNDQLIVDLQKQAGLQLFLAQALPDMDHRQFDGVGGSPLART